MWLFSRSSWRHLYFKTLFRTNIITTTEDIERMTSTTRGKHKFNRKRILVSVESYNPLTEETKHISVWSIDRKHLRSIHKTLREKFGP
jgi:hypothetical protein